MKWIRVEIRIPGVGYEAHEYESCPIMAASDFDGVCPLNGIECRYGLTMVEPPETCPLGPIEEGGEDVMMRFNIVDGK